MISNLEDVGLSVHWSLQRDQLYMCVYFKTSGKWSFMYEVPLNCTDMRSIPLNDLVDSCRKLSDMISSGVKEQVNA